MTHPITFFNGASPFSNFYRTSFSAPNRHQRVSDFAYSEQYFMYVKALVFNDRAIADKIAAHSNEKPQYFKRLGRQLKHYDKYGAEWEAIKNDVMYNAVVFKFSNPDNDLRNQLLATGDAQLIEASPYDSYWGAGVAKDDLAYQNHNKLSDWDFPGENHLGEILMQVRHDMQTKSVKIKRDALIFK